MKRMFTVSTLIAVWLTLIAIYYRKMTEDQLKDRVHSILSALLVIDNKNTVDSLRIAVGYDACQDIVVNASDLLECSHTNHTGLEEINSFDDLQAAYSHFFQHGAAAERFVQSDNFFDDLVAKVQKCKSARFNIGGNAALMAKRFALQGCSVMLGAPTTAEFRKRLPENVQFAGDPIEKDDIHLVFEYASEEKCGPFIAPRANRFIVRRDFQNSRISSLEIFDTVLETFRPHLLIVSGLQMMDTAQLSSDFIDDKLTKINKQIISQPSFTKVHFEMASISNKYLFEKIFELIVPFVDSIGTNEQELDNILSMLKHNKISSAVNSNPKRREMLDTMREVFSALVKFGHKVTRLHVHTLGYQTIMVLNSSDWQNTQAAVAKASLVANIYVCGTLKVELDKATVLVDDNFSTSSIPGSRRIYVDDDNPVTCWNEDNDLYICMAPNIVCTKAKQTAGCGDNVSAAGLAAQFLTK